MTYLPYKYQVSDPSCQKCIVYGCWAIFDTKYLGYDMNEFELLLLFTTKLSEAICVPDPLRVLVRLISCTAAMHE